MKKDIEQLLEKARKALCEGNTTIKFAIIHLDDNFNNLEDNYKPLRKAGLKRMVKDMKTAEGRYMALREELDDLRDFLQFLEDEVSEIIERV